MPEVILPAVVVAAAEAGRLGLDEEHGIVMVDAPPVNGCAEITTRDGRRIWSRRVEPCGVGLLQVLTQLSPETEEE